MSGRNFFLELVAHNWPNLRLGLRETNWGNRKGKKGGGQTKAQVDEQTDGQARRQTEGQTGGHQKTTTHSQARVSLSFFLFLLLLRSLEKQQQQLGLSCSEIVFAHFDLLSFLVDFLSSYTTS